MPAVLHRYKTTTAQAPASNTTRGGVSTVDVAKAGLNPSAVLSDVSKQELKFYNQYFKPHNRQLIDSVDSTELVDIAKANANTSYDQAQQRNNRNLLRYGFTPTALDRQQQQFDEATSRSLNYDNLVNSARLNQYDRNVGLRNELVNTSRGIAKSAMDGLSTAAQLQTQRENTNDSLAAQNKAQKTQMLGTAAGLALMLMI